ncbi:NUDIX hydrolase [Streptomyces sp. NPDC008079]|uniref:NUDIX hydrolase n=1 Tax=Streptomyces sp. NPDC008079 TaxID=3364806 RepID=UPI0036E75B68
MTDQGAESRPHISAAVVVQRGRVLMVRRRVAEGQLSWQFPAGKIEPGESPEGVAVRETLEEAGLSVEAVRSLGERIHPDTHRHMSYIACEVVSGTAHVADRDEVAEVTWCAHSEISAYVPAGLLPPVQQYLDDVLPR